MSLHEDSIYKKLRKLCEEESDFDFLFDRPGVDSSYIDDEDEVDEEEQFPNAKEAGDVKTIKKGTPLYHGAYKDRAKEISKVKRLLARPPHKSSGGLLTEGGLIWFTTDPSLAKEWATGSVDAISASAAEEEEGKKRELGTVFVYKANQPLSLIRRRHRLSAEEAEIINKALQMADYKKLYAGDNLSAIEWRYSAIGVDYPTYSTPTGEMMVIYPIALRALGYDGIYDDSGIALAYDKDLDVEESKEIDVVG